MNINDFILAGKLAGGGGGETLPTPTASNVGAALVVVKQNNPGAVIVPEQTLTLEEGGGVPENSNKSLFTAGTEVIAVINGVEYTGVIYNNGEDVNVVFDDDRYGFNLYEDNLVFFDEDWGETATIKLNVLETTYGYALDKYAGYDIVVETAYSDNTLSHYTPLKWDYPTIHNKVLNGEAVTGILCYHYNYDVQVDGDTNIDIFPLIETNIAHNDGHIIFKGFGGTTGKLIYTITFDTAGEWSSVSKGTWS